MGRNCLQEQDSLLGKSILDGMLREGNKGGEREGSIGTGEKQTQENRGETEEKWDKRGWSCLSPALSMCPARRASPVCPLNSVSDDFHR